MPGRPITQEEVMKRRAGGLPSPTETERMGIYLWEGQIGEIPEETPAVHALRKTSVGAFRIGTTTGAK